MIGDPNDSLFDTVFGNSGLMEQVFGKDISDTVRTRRCSNGITAHRFGWHKVVYENGQMVYVATLPGATKEGMSIQVEDGILRIKATITGDGYLIPESDTFESSARVPDRFDPTKAEATCTNGLLKVTFPVKETAKPKTVTIL